MNRFQKFWYKLFRFEYWPFYLLYIPVFFYYFWLSIKCRSFFFFTSSNPGIEFGGMLGESKNEIYNLIPTEYLPVTGCFKPGISPEEISAFMQQKNLQFPVILKPDIGERGWMVEKIEDKDALKIYLGKIKVPFLIQELIDYPVELGIFYIRKPSCEKGKVTSIVRKGFLSVKGDGIHTVRKLLSKNKRALLNFNFESEFKQEKLDFIPQTGEEITIEEIGNHSRGTIFYDDHSEIDEDLKERVNQIAVEIPGFYFGRFDIRCQSYDDFKSGKNFKIIELNGAGAEPGHIYQPGYSLLQAYRDIIWHLAELSRVSLENKSLGYPFWSLKKGLSKIAEIRRYNKHKA